MVKKFRNARHAKQIIWQATCKSLDVWDIQSQNQVGELCNFASNHQTKSILDSTLFFQGLLENFLRVVWPCLIYWKGPLNIVFYDGKNKTGPHDTSNRLDGRKRAKVWIFETSTFRIGLASYAALLQKCPFLKWKMFSKTLKKFSKRLWKYFSLQK